MNKGSSNVYCPNCGEAFDSALLYCPKCGESLKDAPAADPHEYRRRIRREKAEKRNILAAKRKENRNALFSKYSLLKPLLYILAGLAAIGLFALLWKIASVSTLWLLITITVLLVPLYIWYSSYVLNNLGYFRSRQIENLHFGAVFGGFLIIVLLIYMIIMLITE